MASYKPKKKKRKVKKRIRITQKASIVRKDSLQRDTIMKDTVKSDTLPRMQARPPADVAPTFRIKIRKKR